jgi:hypothetical protein
VASEYPQIATELLEPLTRLLQLARTYCDGDIDKFLVVMVIALRTTQHPDFRAARPEQIVSGEMPILPSLGVNIRSIADSLGVPKETVRRKVQELIEAEWAVRLDGFLYFKAKGYADLAPVREELEMMAVRYYEVVAQLSQRS